MKQSMATIDSLCRILALLNVALMLLLGGVLMMSSAFALAGTLWAVVVALALAASLWVVVVALKQHTIDESLAGATFTLHLDDGESVVLEQLLPMERRDDGYHVHLGRMEPLGMLADDCANV